MCVCVCSQNFHIYDEILLYYMIYGNRGEFARRIIASCFPISADVCVFSQIVLTGVDTIVCALYDRIFKLPANELGEFRKFQYLRAGYEKILYMIYSKSLSPIPRRFARTYNSPDIHPLSEDSPEDPIQKIFTRNLGIFAAKESISLSIGVSRMIGG